MPRWTGGSEDTVKIDPRKCVACGNCVAVCPMGAIRIDRGVNRARIDADECVECYTCYRGMSMEHLNPTLVRAVRATLRVFRLRFDPEPDICPTSAIVPDELQWPRTVRRAFSDVTATHESTGVHGRGTEEVKTNDVTGRVGPGDVGFTVELGRPGVGVRFTDVQKVAQALAGTPARFEDRNPITTLMTDRERGLLNPDVLGEKVMSCIIEVATTATAAPEVLEVLRDVARRIDTVMAIGVALRCDDRGADEIERILAGTDYDVIWAKTNVGLGRANPARVPRSTQEAHA